jgi:pyrroline-5-carboxylate reductase
MVCMASLAIAGFGKLGSAIVRGAIGAGVVAAGDVVVWARSDVRRREATELGLRLADWPDVLGASDRVLLALKPQFFATMTAERPSPRSGAVVISVMGGWRAADVGRRLGTDHVIRAMPTVAAAVGASVTALAIGPGVPARHAEFARRLFAAVGSVLPLPEALFDAATAVGASGVGFTCLFVEALERAGLQVGLEATAARELAVGALEGAARCLRLEAVSPDQLRQRVTSPGGTTAAGVQAMQSGDLEGLVTRGVEAAVARATELGRTDA